AEGHVEQVDEAAHGVGVVLGPHRLPLLGDLLVQRLALLGGGLGDHGGDAALDPEVPGGLVGRGGGGGEGLLLFWGAASRTRGRSGRPRPGCPGPRGPRRTAAGTGPAAAAPHAARRAPCTARGTRRGTSGWRR